MPTPYDGKILLVQVKGQFLARKSIGDVSRMIVDNVPNVDGVFLQTSQGREWQGKFDNDAKEINGPNEISQWVSAMASRGLDTHVWGIPHGLSIQEEAQKFIDAAKTPGVKSLGLDVEHGANYYRGTADAARQMMQLIRDALGWDFHIALILDARRNRPFNVFVDPWLPLANSLHPMVYPKDFGKPAQDVLDAAFSLLQPYGKPIVPMLQSYNGVNPADITLQGNYAFQKGAAGISYFCLGDRQMNAPEFAAVAAVQSPGKQKRPTPEKLPPGAVGLWPDDARGYSENVYENVASRPWHDFRDAYGHNARWKLTSPTNDVAVSYTPNLPAPGRYSVEIFIPLENAEATRADYHVIYHDGGQEKERQVKIDQSARSDEWASLGVFDLDSRTPGDGRVNVTDFSDEQPSQPVAFAGVRWVPVAADRPASAGTTTTVTPRTATTTVAASQPQITNQEVINAFIVGASKFGDSWQNLIASAKLTSIYDNRKAPYTGPAIAALPSLGTDRKAAVAEALKMSPADLAKAAANVSKPQQPGKGKIDGRTWGVHGAAGSAAPPRQMWDFWIRELKEMGIKWYKQCDSTGPQDTGDGSIFRWVLKLRDAGITPVVRYQMGHQFPNRLDSDRFEKMTAYVREGIVYAEIGNEPNLAVEWSWPQEKVSWQNNDCIRAVAENWLGDAEEAVKRGARPAWYAMAPTDWQGGVNEFFSGPKWQELCWRYIGSDAGRKERTRAIFRSGGWVAVHVAVYEFPFDFDPFNHGIGGKAPWDMCLRGYEIPRKYIADTIGMTPGKDMPIMSTESGVFTPESRSMGGHQTLPNDEVHGDLVLKMFDWLEENSPLQAMMPWTLAVADEIGLNNPDFPADGWYYDQGGLKARPVVSKLKAAHARRK
ncbi:MAG TPA: hypothetical protein VJL59_16895 [Anaerolineales bacterium]|nr:hypothetical protein [Anaerolineales bacterium]